MITLSSLRLLTEAEYASLRGVSIRTVKNERTARTGPAFIRVGRRTFYSAAAVQSWLEAREVSCRRATP